jgi:hypothetical protein
MTGQMFFPLGLLSKEIMDQGMGLALLSLSRSLDEITECVLYLNRKRCLPRLNEL